MGSSLLSPSGKRVVRLFMRFRLTHVEQTVCRVRRLEMNRAQPFLQMGGESHTPTRRATEHTLALSSGMWTVQTCIPGLLLTATTSRPCFLLTTKLLFSLGLHPTAATRQSRNRILMPGAFTR